MRSVPFHKMHGTGNDFIVLDNMHGQWDLDELIELTPKICHRRFGVGADGLLALSPSNDADYTMIYRNSDGSDAGMCGNGSRCLAMYAHTVAGFSTNLHFRVHENKYTAHISGESVTIAFPMTLQVNTIKASENIEAMFTQPGNNHIILTEEEAKDKAGDNVFDLARKLRYDSTVHPDGSNVNIYQKESADSILLRTYERGVEDFTYACGTGSIATAVAAHTREHSETTQQTFQIRSKGGVVSVGFEYDPKTKQYFKIKLTGPAEFICEGIYAW